MTRILQIVSGSDTVDLMDKTKYVVQLYAPKVSRYKQGGQFQDSPLHEGRVLSNRVFTNISEIIRFSVVGTDADVMEQNLADLISIVEKAANYWQGVETDITYIELKLDEMTNSVYALLMKGDIEELNEAFGRTVELGIKIDGASSIPGMSDLTFGIERGHWLGNAPGVGTAVQVSSNAPWLYQSLGFVFQANVGSSSAEPSLVQGTDGKIYLGSDGQIDESVDEGDSWSSTTIQPTDDVSFMLVDPSTTNIYAGQNANIWRSENQGGIWTSQSILPTDPPYSGIISSAGTVIVGGSSVGLHRSTDDGDNFSLVSFGALVKGRDFFGSIFEYDDKIYRYDIGQARQISEDDGLTWTGILDAYGLGILSFTPQSFLRTTDGLWLVGGRFHGDAALFRSSDFGTTWVQVPGAFNQQMRVMLQSESGTLWLLDNPDLWTSLDGISWRNQGDINGTHYAFIETAANTLVAFNGAAIYTNDVADLSLGSETISGHEHYISNKHTISNLTHVFQDDGGVFTSLFPISSFPIDIWPSTLATNDAVYFGTQSTIVDAGVFDNLVFNLDPPASVATAWVLTYEYWNGSWTALTVHDDTASALGPFTQRGICSIHWIPPTDWTTTVVNSITAYWIRARVTTTGAVSSPAEQETRNIFSSILPFFSTNNVSGDMSAMARVRILNRSDEDGRGGSAPDLWSNRIIMGLRTLDRGEYFRAFLSCSDQQDGFGVAASLGTNTTFVDDLQAPTTRRAVYNPAGVEAMATRVSIALDTSVSTNFRGVFQTFVRARRTSGNITDFDIRLAVVNASGGVTFTTASKQLQTTTAWELLDFGQIDLSLSELAPSDVLDQTEIRIQASAASGTPDLYLYDLVVIPVDENAIDAVDQANTSSSILGQSNNIKRLIDIDSISNPKQLKSVVIRNDLSDLVSAIWTPFTHGATILQPGQTQKAWFLSARTNAVGSNPVWISEPWVCHSVQVFKNERYLSLRGSR